MSGCQDPPALPEATEKFLWELLERLQHRPRRKRDAIFSGPGLQNRRAVHALKRESLRVRISGRI